MDLNLNKVITVALVFASFIIEKSQLKQCPRDKSRTVSSVVRERLLPVFQKRQLDVSAGCPFSIETDMYAIQEGSKIIDGSSKWTCDFCGKAFVAEYYLDKHFDNRHMDRVQGKGSICLADNCDVFRCDIISGASIPDFWDIALCLEDDMIELASQCETMLDLCIPKGLTNNETTTIRNELKENVCSFLTCTKFWNTPFEKADNSYLALYVVLACLTTFGIIIYTFVFYNYFYSDMVDGPAYDPSGSARRRHKIKPYPGHRPLH